MFRKTELKKAIRRVRRYEKYFDELSQTFKRDGETAFESRDFLKKLKKLTDYYENGLWLSDYERDEKGEFPKELKRGCLSQDGIYDLLFSVDSAKKCEKEL